MSHWGAMVQAEINFGNKAASFFIENNSTLQIQTPRANEMLIETGNLGNQGFGTITGNNVRFRRGAYTFFNSVSDIDALWNPDKNIIYLASDVGNGGGTMIANPGGLSGNELANLPPVSVTGLPGNNILRGQPLFFGTDDLTAADQTTAMAVAVQNTLNTNIWLNGGYLFLQDDLRLGDDAIIKDSGRVIFNNRRLTLGGTTSKWEGRIIWDSTRDMQMNSAVILKGEWVFLNPDTPESPGQINGNGNIIDISGEVDDQGNVISNGGKIFVMAGSSLRLAGVHIIGLGKQDWQGKIVLEPGATLYLTDVVIEMDDDYDIEDGTVYVEGNSTVITKDHLLTFKDNPVTGTNGKLIVDKVTLTYDPQASIDNSNIRPLLIQDPDRKYVEIYGAGEIRKVRSETITFHSYRSAPTLQRYAIVAPYLKFDVFPEVDPDTGERNYDVIVDGNTNFLGFTKTDEQIFTITNGVKATLTNIIMRDFSPKHVKFENNESKLTFGDKTTITLARNETLDYPWVFEGDVVIRGAGNILELGPQGVLEVKGENSRLLLDGVILKGVKGTNVRCLADSSRIILKGVKWIQSDNFSYGFGGIDILDDSSILGSYQDFYFGYFSTQSLRIFSNATLSLLKNIVFSYNPQVLRRPALYNLFEFADTSSALYLEQATLEVVPPAALTLSGGRLIIRDQNFSRGTITIAQDMVVDQPAGATLEQS